MVFRSDWEDSKNKRLMEFFKKQVGEGMKSLLNAAEAEGEERNSSSSFNLSITVTDTTTTNLLSDKSLQIPKQGSMVKGRRLRALELLRYLYQCYGDTPIYANIMYLYLDIC